MPKGPRANRQFDWAFDNRLYPRSSSELFVMSLSVVLGTRNPKKRKEIAQLLEPRHLIALTLDDFPNSIEIAETGSTFAENAALKATLQAKHLGEWVLADDSGIAVDALNGAPGVCSARFAGENASDSDNNRLLLQRLSGVPSERRTAHYVCHLVLADGAGEIRARSEARCNGRIREAPAGDFGFGYDPYFEIAEYHRTFAELGETVKTVLSHRARAFELLLPQIDALNRAGAFGER